MSSKPGVGSVQSLFSNAAASGEMSQAAAQIFSAPDIAAVINQGMCPAIADMEVHNPYVTVGVYDDSGSLEMGGITKDMVDGANHYRAELMKSATKDDILYGIQTINGRWIYPIGDLVTSPELVAGTNITFDGGTPLYDQIITASGVLLAELKRQKDLGNAGSRGAFLLGTDGFDEHSTHSAEEAATALEALFATERVLVFMIGITNQLYVRRKGKTFKQVFMDELRVPERFILEPNADGKSIRKAFQIASQASKTASQGAASHSQIAQSGLTAIT